MLYFIDKIAIDMLFVHRQYFENTREGQGEISYMLYSIDNIAIDILLVHRQYSNRHVLCS